MKKPDLKSFKTIAIVQTAFLGDTALTLYLCQAIKNYHPKCNLILVCTPQTAGLVTCSTAVDNVISYDKRGVRKGYDGIKFLANELNFLGAECIIAPHRSLRTGLMAFLSDSDYNVGFNTSTGFFLFNRRIPYIKNFHEVERNYKLLSAFRDYSEILTKDIKVELDIHEADKSYIESKLLFKGITETDEIVCLAPGSVWKTKEWKKEYFVELAVKLKESGYKAILIGGGNDVDLCSEIASESKCESFAGITTMPQTLYLLKLAKLLVTNDSGPTHLAGLVGCNTITIFGPTSPKFGFYPLGTNDKVLEDNSLKCKPCHIHGKNECPVKTHDCMNNVKPETVFNECLKILSVK